MPPYLSETEAATWLRVSSYTVVRWIKQGHLDAEKVPGGWRVTRSTLEAFVAKNRVSAAAQS